MKLLWIFVLCAASACGTYLEGSGEIEDYKFEVQQFSELSVAVPAEFRVEESNTPYLELEIDDNLINHVRVRENSDQLVIEWEDEYRRYDPTQFVIRMGTSDLRAIEVLGSGDGLVERMTESESQINVVGSGDLTVQRIDTDSLGVSVTGSGSVNLKSVRCDDAALRTLGSGDLEAEGQCDKVEAELTGSGELYGAGFVADDIAVEVLGSGGAEVWAKQTLDVQILGSGDVVYGGNPKINSEILGSGSLSTLN